MSKRTRTSSVRRPLFKRRWFWPALAILVLLASAVAVWRWPNNTSPTSATNSTGAGVSPAPPSNGATRNPSTTNSTLNQGGANDQNGKTPTSSTPNSSQWTVSDSGLLTLKSPVKNSAFKSGDNIYGAASAGPVQFRLIDNQVGVIAQGSINVVGGSFSATASFTPHSTSGRLDVFNTDPNGKEINEVQVPVSF